MPAKDAFLSHNSSDKPAVEELARRLEKEGVSCWLDKWHLIPGDTWQEGLESALNESRSCAVFLGPAGIGPWQNEELRRAIARRVQEGASGQKFRVLPVLLPGARREERSLLPDFLVRAIWVEFRQSLDEPEAFHRLKCGILGLAPGQSPGEALFEGDSPYRGLEAFEPKHAPFYFGREADIGWIADELRRGSRSGEEVRFLAIIGSSGSGKSSLAKAGLVPALGRGVLPGSESWPLVILRPGPNPLESLAIRLGQDPVLKSGAGFAGDLEKRFLQEDNTLHLVIRQAIDRDDQPAGRAVLVIDQFEETFTVCEDEAARRAFIANLLYAATVAGGRTIVIPTMRADFYPKCAAYPKLAAALSDHQLLLGPMERESMREVIERPAQLAGGEFEPGLVEMLLDDMDNQPPGALPLLEHCLHQLWERREGRRLTVAAYHETGRIEGALERHADRVFDSLSPGEQAACARLFLQLVRPGEGSADTKRQALLDRAAPDETSRKVVDLLAGKDARLLTSGQSGEGAALLEITHESLIGHWGRLRRWIEDNRQSILVQQRLEQDAREWDENGRQGKYLYDGARLEEGKEWMRANRPQARHFPVEFDFIRAAHARASRRVRFMTGTTIAALVLAAVALFAVEKALQARDAARKTEGLQALETARRAPDVYPDRIFYTAKAIGFSGFSGEGKQEDAPRVFLAPSYWAEAWRLLGNIPDQNPVLVPEEADAEKEKLAAMPAYLPFWRSGAYGKPVTGLEVTPTHLRAAYEDGKAREWELGKANAEGRIVEATIAPSAQTSGVEFDGTIVRLKAFGHHVDLTSHPSTATAWALPKDKRVLYVGMEDGSVIAWDLGKKPVGDRDLLAYLSQGWLDFNPGDQKLMGKAGAGAAEFASLPAAEPAPFDPSKRRPFRNSLGMEFVFVEHGNFTMGSKDGGEEEKAHPVTLTQDFWLGAYEVTQAEWQAVMGNNPSNFPDPLAPVESVSWDDCREFLKKLNAVAKLPEGWIYALPTEAQWEYACRAGTETEYFFGKELLPSQANFSSSAIGKTVAAGRYQGNKWGLYDMHGNVSEWCADVYAGEYYAVPEAAKDPPGPSSGANRVVRGGGWFDDAVNCRSADRDWFRPDVRGSGLGFRLALSPIP